MANKPVVRGESRAVPRVDCAVSAIIHDQGREIACVVEDFSISGCRVRLPTRVLLSDEFDMEFTRRDIHVAAELIWINGEEAGIRFRHKLQTVKGKKDAAAPSVAEA